MMKYLITILAILLVIPVHAGLLDINGNIRDGYIITNETRYRILDDSNVFVQFIDNGFTSYRRIIVEDANIVDNLNKTANELLTELADINEKIKKLEADINSSEKMKQDAKNLLESLRSRRDELKSQLDEVLEKKQEYENMLTGGAVFSTTSFWMTIIIFIILLVAVSFLKFYERGKNKTNMISFSGDKIEGISIGYQHENHNDSE